VDDNDGFVQGLVSCAIKQNAFMRGQHTKHSKQTIPANRTHQVPDFTLNTSLYIRGVQLAKMTLVQFCKKMWFLVQFNKIYCTFIFFRSVFATCVV